MTFKNYKSLKIGDWNFKKLIRASDGLVLFEKYSKPYDAEIAYLETTGQQCIDTGIFPSLDMEFNTKIYTPKVFDDYFCSLRKDGNNTRYYLLNYNRNAGYACTKSVWPGAFKKPDDFLTNTHIIKSKITQDKVSIEVDGLYFEDADKGGLFSPDKTLPLFGAKLNNSTTINTRSNAGTRCYYAKFISNGQVVGDFIPVRVGNVGYMYDKVSGKLFGNLGAGNFILGPDIVENPYVTDGLVAMWDSIWNTDFNNHDQNATTWIDLVGNNVVTTTSTTAPTALGNGFRFNGSQYFTVTPDDNIKSVGTNNHDITVEIGFNANPQSKENQGLLGFGTSSQRNIWMFFGNPPTSTSSTLDAQLQKSSSLRLWYKQGVFPTGTKHHVVFSSSSTTMSGWLDGIKVSSTRTIGKQTSLGQSFIGRISSYNNFYGDIYFIRIYNRALTEDEIAANYAIDKQRFNI